MINLKFLNEALGKVSSDEFAVLFFIANTMSLKKEHRTRIYRELIADKLGWYDEKRPKYSMNKVSKITSSLVEKGWLIKEEVFVEGQKSVNFYSLPKQKSVSNLPLEKQKSVVLNKKEKEVIKEKRLNKSEYKEECIKKDIYKDDKKLFKELCDAVEEEPTERDDFDYASMNKLTLVEYEKALEENLIPVNQKNLYATKCY